jgi:hypothetical protein
MDKHFIPHQKPVPAHITRHLTDQPKSGKTIAAYCRNAGISAWSFYNWRKLYGKQIRCLSDARRLPPTTQPAPPLLPFTALGTMSTQTHQPLFDIRFSVAGTRISIYSGATARELAPFLELLSNRGAPC